MRLSERFAKESCGARWKVSRWGFRPPGLHLIVEEGRCFEYKLSLAPFFSLFLFVYSGRGRQPTYMKRRREERGFPEIKVSGRSKKATSGSNRCFGHSVDSASPCSLSCWQKQGFRPYLLLDLNQWLSPYESDTLTAELSRLFILRNRKKGTYLSNQWIIDIILLISNTNPISINKIESCNIHLDKNLST